MVFVDGSKDPLPLLSCDKIEMPPPLNEDKRYLTHIINISDDIIHLPDVYHEYT
jgi:hypothetical protein